MFSDAFLLYASFLILNIKWSKMNYVYNKSLNLSAPAPLVDCTSNQLHASAKVWFYGCKIYF